MFDTCALALDRFELSDEQRAHIQATSAGADGFKSRKLPSRVSPKSCRLHVRFIEHPVPSTGKYSYTRYLVIECSVPKLLYENSIQELMASDKDRAIKAMTEGLQVEYGITCDEEAILTAMVKRVDFVRNIPLPVASDEFFNAASLCTRKPHACFENSNYGFNREGRQARWFTKQSALSLYDKVSEIANDKSVKGKEMLEKFHQAYPNHSLLRCEYRLTKHAPQKHLAKFLSRPLGITFEDLWDPTISSAILLEALQGVIGLPLLLKNIPTQKDEISGATKREVYHIKQILREARRSDMETALREFKESLSESTYYRILKILKHQTNIAVNSELDVWGLIKNHLITHQFINL